MKSYIAILLVSVGKENFEKESIKSAVQMINSEFKGCCIVVADTLQRYNIASEKDITPQDSYEESLEKGESWVDKYQSYFADNFDIPYEILRWDSLLQDSQFKEKAKIFSGSLQTNSFLAQAMEYSIEEYGQRLKKRLGSNYFNQIQSRYKQNCLSYLSEECVALTFIPKYIKLTSRNTPVVIVYPGKSTSILTANRDLFIKDEFNELVEQYDDYLNWIPYRFTRVKQLTESSLLTDLLRNPLKDKTKEQQVDNINLLSEAQLDSMSILFDVSSLNIFEALVLDSLINNDPTYFKQQNSSCEQAGFSIKNLAVIFANQMMSMFNTLDEKYANKCRANLIKKLKKRQLNFTNTNPSYIKC